MAKIIFYDPGKHHDLLSTDPAILYLRSEQYLCESGSINDNAKQVVCICCRDLSTIVDQLQKKRKNVLIYLCKEHDGHETNPTFNDNVRDNIVFSSDNEWKFEIYMDVIELSPTNGNKKQAEETFDKLISEGQDSSSPLRTSIENEDENISSDTSHEDSPSEESQEY